MAMIFLHNSLLSSSAAFNKTHFSFHSPLPFSEEMLKSLHISRRNKSSTSSRGSSWAPKASSSVGSAVSPPKLRILVAGGGIGGLVFALAAKKKGFDVLVFEKDMSAVRGEGEFRGPIQIQSSALAVLEAIDLEVAEEVMSAGCITGNRINGFVDGISGSWYVKFDMFTPAVERGLPVTRVISRMELQHILARAVGNDAIVNDSNVIDFVDDGTKVTVTLKNGQQFEGDLLVGADGIWSKVRKILFGHSEACYAGYTCYTGIADFVPADIESVGYRVFLGYKKYFVACDVGAGRMQWYAFHKQPPGGTDVPNGRKERLLNIFEGWCDNVINLIVATFEENIIRRDIYDRVPVLSWGRGRVTLLGDSVHAMQPNMGQGGCMAIEDSYQLALELEKASVESAEAGTPIDIVHSLKRYEKERRLRVAFIQGMARLAAIMASFYRPYLDLFSKFRIPHPGIVGGRFLIKYLMPRFLSWVLGGNSSKLEGRSISCRLTDKPNDLLQMWFEDDDGMECALSGEWYLFPSNSGNAGQPIRLIKDEKRPYIIGSQSHTGLPGTSIKLSFPQVAEEHARISCKDSAFYITDLHSDHGTWITDNECRRYRVPPNFPVRFHPSYTIEFGSDKKAVFRVKVLSQFQNPC